MKGNSITIMLAMVLSLSLLSCERESSPTAPSADEQLSRIEAQVVANCLTVQAALEEYAFFNYGLYLYCGDWDYTPYGWELVDFFPRRGCLFENPATLADTEPWFNWIAVTPGQTGVQPILALNVPVGYMVSGTGEELGVNICTLTNIASYEEARVLAQCFHFEERALSRYMWDNDDTYPHDVDTDQNLIGKTVRDYWIEHFGDNTYIILNVFTGEPSEPRNGTAYDPGSIAYSPVVEEDIVIGCIITAAGESPGDLILNRRGMHNTDESVHWGCRLLEKAVLEFAWRNNMVLPNDLTNDTDLAGGTVSSSYYYRDIYNPYLGKYDENTKPVLGTAYGQGEIAYRIDADGGYVITGVGKYPGVIIARREYDLSEADKAIYKRGALLRTAAMEFIETNNSVIAADFDTDQNIYSQTIFDLLPSRLLIWNPVSSGKTGIVNGRAAYPGETGYIGWETGFRITSINEAGYYIIDYIWRPES